MSSASHLAQVSQHLLAPALILELANDLRQPLSSIEAIAYYLEMTLPAEQLQARHYMHHLQELVNQTSSILKDACRFPVEREDAAHVAIAK